MNIAPEYSSLIKLLSNRLFKIPPYQRAYSWGTREREDLFSDIRKSYEAQNNNDHFMATIVGLCRKEITIGTDEFKEVDIVDGQQRLTTLILLFKAIAEALDRSNRDEKKTGEQIDEFLVKQDKTSLLLLQTNHDGSEYFADYIRHGKETDNEAETLADRAILLAIKECKKFVKEWRDSHDSLDDLVIHLKNRLTFIFHEIGDEKLVYTVFEVLNSRGLAVSSLDRLKSMLMSIVFEAEGGNKDETIKEIHELWAGIYRIIGLRQGLSTESLRFAATLRSEDSPSRPLGEEDAVQLLLKIPERKPEKVIEVTKWVKSVTEAVDKLRKDQRRNAVTKIVQARLVAVAVNLRSDLTTEDRNKILRRWENVTFRIYGMYGHDARTSVGDYTRLAWKIIEGKLSVNEIMEELSSIGRRYPSNEAAKKLQKKDCYSSWKEELRYFFRRYEEHLAGPKFNNEHWHHIWRVSASDSIEHILPQKTEKSYLHWLGNLVILSPGTNSTLGAKQPKDKADEYRKTGLLIAGDVANRITKVGKWRRLDIIKREEELINWAKKEWAD